MPDRMPGMLTAWTRPMGVRPTKPPNSWHRPHLIRVHPLPFSENRDLAGVVEVVLDRSMEQKIHGVVTPRHRAEQLRIIEPRDGAVEGFVPLSETFERSLPGRGARVAHRRPVLLTGELDRLALDPPLPRILRSEE